jgi:hypothetical protein
MIRFEWDEGKAKANVRKHGVSFEEGSRVFNDPYAVFREDRIEDGELRWHAIGVAEGITVLLVAHTIGMPLTDQTEVIRIISARRATRKEQTLYDQDRAKDYGGY